MYIAIILECTLVHVQYNSKVTSHSLAIVSLVSRIPSTRSSTLVKDHSLYIESESLESASTTHSKTSTHEMTR